MDSKRCSSIKSVDEAKSAPGLIVSKISRIVSIINFPPYGVYKYCYSHCNSYFLYSFFCYSVIADFLPDSSFSITFYQPYHLNCKASDEFE